MADEQDEVGTRPHKDAQQEPHPCPYMWDINNDPDYRCTCCESCEQECADDI